MSKPSTQYTKLEDLPDKPKKPLIGFFLYKAEVYAKCKAENPELKLTELVVKISNDFKKLSEKDKAKYDDAYKKEKVTYDKLMEQWKKKYSEIEAQLKKQAKKGKEENPKKDKEEKRARR